MSHPPEDRSGELRALFFESAGELLQSLNEAGLELEAHPADEEVIRRVRRAVHTLKGDSAACGYYELSELAHELEDVLSPATRANPRHKACRSCAGSSRLLLGDARRVSAEY